MSSLSWLRVLVGLPVVLLVPGFFFAPMLLGKSIRHRADPEQLDLLWTLLGSFGLNILCHFIQIRILAGGGASTLRLNTLVLGLAAFGLFINYRRGHGLLFRPPAPEVTKGVLWGAGVLTLLVLLLAPKLVRDSSWYFYNPQLESHFEGADKPEKIVAAWADGNKFVNGDQFKRRGRIMGFRIENRAAVPQKVPVILLVHGPVGTEAWIDRVSEPAQAGRHDRIATSEVMAELGQQQQQIERYYDWGTAGLTLLECRDDPTQPPYDPNEFCEGVEVPAGGSLDFELHIRPFEYAPSSDPEETYVTGWIGLSKPDLEDALGSLGHQHMHPFQLLNVTENIRWAEEMARGDFVLPGRPARLSAGEQGVALAQPPAWSYLYAPARRLIGEQTATASALLLSFLLFFVIVGLKAIEDEVGIAPYPLLGAALGFAAVQGAQLMIRDGSINFPDNLYALALLVSAAGLVSRRTRVFVVWAVLAALLRYPGAVVVGMAGGALFLLAPKQRRSTVDALARFTLVIAIFCAGMLVWGIRSGLLDAWFYSLYWETVPEHFQNNANAAPLLIRPIVFNLKWMCVGGGLLIVAFPFRGTLSRVMAVTALAYMPFLAFIDHHSNHYFLPLILMAALSACASVAHTKESRRRTWALVVALTSCILFLSSHQGRSAVERFSDRISVPHRTLPLGPEGEATTPPEDAPEEEVVTPPEDAPEEEAVTPPEDAPEEEAATPPEDAPEGEDGAEEPEDQ